LCCRTRSCSRHDRRQHSPGDERIQDADVAKAAEDVNLGDFVRALPNGFNEEVRERGSTLSTGQKQLISFARALAHEPKILILDEATSSVDTETEFKVRDALARMVEGRTSLIIAHRLSTVQRADKIIVMHKGQVREMGTHQELLAQRGIYFKLYQLQYKDQELSHLYEQPITAGTKKPKGWLRFLWFAPDVTIVRVSGTRPHPSHLMIWRISDGSAVTVRSGTPGLA
jgi:ABC-type multidrug transport system ATPase subunit